MTDKNLNRKERLFHIVKQHVDLWNPESLLPHAPDDEYDIESKKIAEEINENCTAEELAEIISRVFEKGFGGNYDRERCSGCAEAVYRDLNRELEWKNE